MSKKFKLFLIVIILLISFSACGKKSNNDSTSIKLPGSFIPKDERKEAIDFSLSTMDGGSISLKDLKGKVVLLDFWAEWCGPCKAASPIIVSLYEKYKNNGFIVIGMNLDDESDFDKVIEYIKKSKIEYPVTIKGFSVAQKYGVTGIPRFFLIDKDGNIALTITGYVQTLESDLKNSIEYLLKE
ncbi:MAG: TlpA family protein disulfide reductase [Caldisericia bacterium]